MQQDANLEPPEVNDIAAQASLYRMILETSLDMIVCYNAVRERTFVSGACRELVGYEPWEMMAIRTAEFLHPDDYEQLHPGFLAFGPNSPNLKLTFRARRKNGTYIWLEATYRYACENGTATAVFRDITVRKNAELILEEANQKLEAANAMLRQMAQQDGLTGLVNRRRFDELLEREFRRAARQHRPLAVLLLDVDYFKKYNDGYGHLAGDDCLRRIAGRLALAVGRPGDQVARYGGEEFVALLPATDLTGAVNVAERLRESVASLCIPHQAGVGGIATVSIGASSAIPCEDDDPSHLVAAADRALYQAKGDGRNTVRGSGASAPTAAV